ncbi:MAG: DUF3833 domain-containing protein [Burkholderiales bacterium]
MIRRLALAFLLSVLAGCASVDVALYRAERPVLDLAQFFTGTVDGWGMVQDRSGKVLRRFTVRIDGTWNGDRGTLDEHFEYADGTKEQRVWQLARDGNRYTGTAGDVVGTAQGETQGNALHWNYVLAVPVDGRTWHLSMDDWMYLIDDRTLLNRTAMSKFGVDVGSVTLVLRRR